MNLRDGYLEIREAAALGAMPDPELRIDEWSERHMVLPRDSADPGPFRIDRTPMVRRILQVLSPGDPAMRVVIMGASQMLKTQTALNFIAASAHQAPGNMLVLEPTDTLAKRLSARISKTIRDVPVLQSVFAPPRSRNSRNTTYAKDFVGGTMYIATAGAAANLAEIPARYVVIDEVDALASSIEGEGDPVDLAENRATTFGSSCKFLEVSSPRRKGGKISQLFEQGTREFWAVPCPVCQHRHEFVIENFRYERGVDGLMGRAWFVCPSCATEIDETHKARMVAAGDWIARSDGDGETVSFHVSAFYAQTGSISWRKLARQHARARDRLDLGDPEAMQVFYNTRLALAFEHTQERTTVHELQQRQSDDALPPRIVPQPALVLTMSVDTQGNRLEAQVHAWGPGLEQWVIDHKVLMGDPSDPPDRPGSVWQRLDEYRAATFLHEAGIEMRISAFAIDSGGQNTQDVYNYGQARAHLGCLIVHGSSRPDRPIVSNLPSKVAVDWGGQRVEGGALLWTIGTDIAKDHLWNRQALVDGPGAMHFAASLPAAWFEQLLAERPIVNRKTGRRTWQKASAGTRNEALDLAVYNLAVAHQLGLHNWQALDWERARRRLIPAMPPAPAVHTAAAHGAPPAAASTYPPAAPASPGRRQFSRGI